MPGRRRSPGEGSIFQRKDGKWVASIEIGQAFGERRRRRFIRATREAARQELLKVQREGVKRGVADEIVTVSDLLDAWLHSASLRIAHRTLASYQDITEAYLRPTLGRYKLADLEPEHIENALRSWMKAPRRRGASDRPQSAKSLSNYLGALRAALGFAVKRRLLKWNPGSAVSAPRIEEFASGALTYEQFANVLETARGWHQGDHAPHLLVAGAAGLRRGELCGLRWGDVDTEGAAIRVSRSVEIRRDGGGLSVKPPKGRSAEWTDVPYLVIEALLAHRVGQLARLPLVDDSTPVFDDRGAIMSPEKLGKRLAGILRAAKAPKVRLHDLRHSFGTWMVNEGVSTRVVQRQMRHSDIRMATRYTKHIDPAARIAADAIGERLRRALGGDGPPDGSPGNENPAKT
jgi:integrase